MTKPIKTDYKEGDYVFHQFSSTQRFRASVLSIDEAEGGAWLQVCMSKKRTDGLNVERVFSKFEEMEPFFGDNKKQAY